MDLQQHRAICTRLDSLKNYVGMILAVEILRLALAFIVAGTS